MARLFTPSESKYYLMALDAGTGSIRAVIFDLEGNQIAVGQAEWRHLAVPDVPGSMEFDLNKNWQLACECMRQALHNAGIAPEYIAAVSACSMREGIVLYNNEGAPIWACANVDARAAREVSELKELHNNTFENEVYRATGQTLALSAIPRLLWLAHHRSDIYRQASTITMISDWLAYMLSGELAVDPSNAGTTGLLDLTTRDWKPALLDMAGLRADILSPVKETGTLLGVVSSQAAELCGLKAGTPVVVGGGDVQLGCLGLGVVRPAQTAVLGGTFWQQVVNLAAPVTDPEMNVRVNPHVIPGMVQAESISFFTGLTMRWFREFNMYVGTSGTGTLTLTNSGTLNVEGGEVYLGVFEPAVGTLNIGAAHGEAAADAGYITNATKVEFGSGEGVFVFNHTNNSDAGYQVDMLITGDDKDGKVIHDAGHTVFNAGNTYSGKTLVNDGLLTIASHTADGVTGMGSSEVTIASPGTLDILASTNSAGDYTLTNALKGDGLMRVQLSSYDKMFGFTHATGTEFAGVAQLKDSTFTLERDNTAALTHAMLQSDSENTTSVKVGEQSIGGLAMNGGTLIFDTDIPAATLAEGYISVDTLVVGAGDYTWKGRNYQVNGTGDVLIDVPKPWNDPMANNPLTTLNLLEHDDSHVGVQLVKAQTVIGSGGSLTLRDLQGDEVEADKTLHIAQNGTVVAEGDYGFRLTTAPGDGLYVNYGLKALNIHGGQKLTLAEHGGAYGATADMSAKIGGEGDLAINTVRQVSLSNGQNDYQGATYVQMGTLRTDADGALGNTRELNISNAAIVDLNGSTQTVETFTGQMGSTVLFKEGALTVNKGGISQGELTGGGNLNVTGGTLAIEGLNARYNALTSISPNAEVSLDNTQGLGRGNIANDGLLTLKNVTGELRNSISGKGIVSATARTDVELDGDNSRFVGQFNIDTGSALSVNEQKNLGDASVINNGLLTISTERSWAMTHSISGSGDMTKLGTGILTLNNDSAAYQGTTDIVGGEIAFGSDSAINMASQHINIHNSGVMSGNVTTAGDVNVMPGGTLRVAKTTIGGNLENGGTVQMNSEGGKPGNVLTVNGNYTGNNGLMTFNATLGGDNSPTDKMNVKGDTQGNTRVRVDNIGGVGAQTVNGIELIEVGGNSAGNFALTTGTVEAGAYVYTLAKGKGNDEKNWYLTSKWDGVTPADTPDPINNPPVVDPEGPSVYRPEAGSYISNIAAANSLFSHRLHDRLGEPQYIDSLHSQGSASSMWMRHVGGHERSRAGDGQLNTQANRYVLQLGGDLAQWSSNAQDRWHLGVMAGYANQHSNTQSNRVGYKSDGRISGYSAGLYATWYQNDANKTGAYVDSWALYNWFDNSVSSDNRSADDYDSRGVTASVEGGYTFEAGTFSGSEGTLNTWYVQPQAQITWMGVKDSDHTRKDGTRIETEGDGNVQTRLGVKTYLNSHHQRDDGKQREFQPYIEANWINNSKVYAVKMNGQTVGHEGARNLGEVRTGVEAKVNNNLSLWGNVGVQLGDKGYSDTQGMLGVKYSW
ncbi:autotransporter protein [Escherichia coli]|uniref:ECSE_1600 family autotransporter n=1 Tax=Escherichia coli TaxID=562 RepID=UPI0010C4A98F|nr:ECSE_1600 family autotransporter [Escherichia coli]GDK22645.1 autotransporter protein [Escherichia coli]